MTGRVSRILLAVLAGSLVPGTSDWVASAGQPAPVPRDPANNVITVAPTGADDTANLQAALDAAVAAGPGSTVRLAPGTFFVSRVVEVAGFQGSLVGSGRDATVVTALPDLPCAEQAERDSWPSLFKFREGDMHLADLSFEITETEPCDEWVHGLQGFPRHDLGAIVHIAGRPIDGTFDCANPAVDFANSTTENVGFRGPGDGSVHDALGIGGENVLSEQLSEQCPLRAKPLSGSHTVAGSSFEKVLVGVDVSSLIDSTVLIGGEPAKKNTFDDTGVAYATLLSTSNSTVEFSHNDVRRVHNFGAVVLQGTEAEFGYPLPSPSRYVVRHNSIHAIDIADGVAAEDLGLLLAGVKTADVAVTNNTIVLDDTLFGGITSFLGVRGMVVANNVITGRGLAGIYVGALGPPFESMGWTVVGNNVQNVEAVVAPIWLGPASSEITVVGGSTRTNVFDQGTDNMVVGVNNVGGSPPGPDVSEAMRRKVELIRSTR